MSNANMGELVMKFYPKFKQYLAYYAGIDKVWIDENGTLFSKMSNGDIDNCGYVSEYYYAKDQGYEGSLEDWAALVHEAILTNRLSYDSENQVLKNTIDDTIKDSLKEYTEDISKTPIEIIDKLLNQITEGTNQSNNAINKIKKELNSTHETLEEKRILLEDTYNLLIDTLSKTKEELTEKRKEINDYKGYESKINEILIHTKDSTNILACISG